MNTIFMHETGAVRPEPSEFDACLRDAHDHFLTDLSCVKGGCPVAEIIAKSDTKFYRANATPIAFPIALTLAFRCRRVYKEQKRLPGTPIIPGWFRE
ncbi:hypothetical protein G3N95_26420 [Paraburkholderia sp. Tr-20389]|uniref:hypothetical protein n=1 Tax=Paraburkholderia sp. Tr-20389 TaxID=2703903 RepID=UPI00197E2D60|nr:hypothetical protein [Paraburkholderia sp. Tr-20389]MBN3756498.1 hypothetical protein [Paraburkholderia sp. Tr-20389]